MMKEKIIGREQEQEVLAMIAPYGLKQNQYAQEMVRGVVKIADLF